MWGIGLDDRKNHQGQEVVRGHHGRGPLGLDFANEIVDDFATIEKTHHFVTRCFEVFHFAQL